ncbi:transposase [Megasphaera cerevisiae]|uniref:transposase n=1 Tax=Megasphaera cerevisiae TaxID=39029 RepID=UPI0006A0019E|nr:transposase [Megasphaera cerevisiae]
MIFLIPCTIQSNPYYNTLLDRVTQEIKSDRGIRLRTNRSIQVEGAFGGGGLKDDYLYHRIQRRGKENVWKELLVVAMGFNLRKLHARLHNGRMHKRFLDKDPKTA